MRSQTRLKCRRILAAVAAFGVVSGPLVGVSPTVVALDEESSTTLSITPLGWNIVGLDSNKVTVGPNQFPIGARVCNTGADHDATETAATWTFDSENPHISLVGASTVSLGTLAPGDCADAWFVAEVARTAAAYNTARQFHITAAAAEASPVATPSNRELFVEKLVSQNRNKVLSLSGLSGPLYVGDTVTITLVGSTSTGYGQFTAAPVLPSNLFQVLSIDVSYAIPTGGTNDQFYADACGWDTSPASASYRSCVGGGIFPGGIAGGNPVTTTIQAKLLAPGQATIGSVLYDFSGSSYHYNSDFSATRVQVDILPGDGPYLALTKSFVDFDDANDNSLPDAGETANWLIEATNAGTEDFTDVAIEDGGEVHNCGPLALGEACVWEVSSTITQDDIDAGEITNTASAIAETEDDGPVSATAFDTEALEQFSSVSVVKTFVEFVEQTGDDLIGAGDAAKWTVVATNDGNTTLTDVVVADDLVDASTTCETLAPGAVCALSPDALYDLTEDDIEAGTVSNTATVTASSPTGDVSGEATDTQAIGGGESLELAKELLEIVDADSDGRDSVGDTATWTLTATNNGEVSLYDVNIDDPLTGDMFSCGTLEPAESCSHITTPVELTQDDIDAGDLSNTATASARSMFKAITAEATDEASLTQVPELVADKFLVDVEDVDGDETASVGDKVFWVISAANTGNVTLTGVVLTDELTGDEFECEVLDVGFVCEALVEYTLTADDVVAGTVTNTVVATASGPQVVSATAVSDVDLPAEMPGVVMPKLFIDLDGDGVQDAGEPGVPNVAMTLEPLDSFGGIKSCTTGVSGECVIRSLPAGEHRLTMAFDAGAYGMSVTLDPDTTADLITQFNLAGSERVAKVFAVRGTSTVAGTLFVDTDRSGRRDEGEPGFGGVKVEVVWAGPDGVIGTADDIVFTVTSDDTGNYSIGSLPAGKYQVRVVTSTLPAGATAPAAIELTVAAGATGIADFPFAPNPAPVAPVDPVAPAPTGVNVGALLLAAFGALTLGEFLRRRSRLLAR
jgi:uncharacterized repeat protein (TIGR01451 family)